MPRRGRGRESPLRLTFEVREALAMDGDPGENEKKKLKVEPSGVTVAWVLETFSRLTLVPRLIFGVRIF